MPWDQRSRCGRAAAALSGGQGRTVEWNRQRQPGNGFRPSEPLAIGSRGHRSDPGGRHATRGRPERRGTRGSGGRSPDGRSGGHPARHFEGDDARGHRPFSSEGDADVRQRGRHRAEADSSGLRRRKPSPVEREGVGYAIAVAFERLIALGHPPAVVWEYTPRQLKAFLIIAERRRRKELSEQLALFRLASHGEAREVNKQIKDLESGEV